MSNRLKDMGETASWRLMVSAAIEGAKHIGYEMQRKPGRGLSNTYEMTKDGKTQVASVRTTRDRAIAFPPLDGGKKWKTLDDVELVLVSAVDDRLNPQNVDVYLFPANEVRQRFNASYAARIAAGHIIRDDYGMWLMIDAGNTEVAGQVGSGIIDQYPAIARFTIDKLEAGVAPAVREMVAETAPDPEETADEDVPALKTVADVMAFCVEKIANLTGMPANSIKLDLKMGV